MHVNCESSDRCVSDATETCDRVTEALRAKLAAAERERDELRVRAERAEHERNEFSIRILAHDGPEVVPRSQRESGLYRGRRGLTLVQNTVESPS